VRRPANSLPALSIYSGNRINRNGVSRVRPLDPEGSGTGVENILPSSALTVRQHRLHLHKMKAFFKKQGQNRVVFIPPLI
jgi:hypothetical protein